ncbi:MAG: VOC family protein [Acidobacteriota bacterium]
MTTQPIPDGYTAITPYLLVEGAAKLLDFLAEAFGAEESFRLDRPDGSLMHAEIRIDDAAVMVGEPMGEFGPMPGSIYLYVKDCDAVYERALAAGGVSVMPVTHMAHAGERYGGVKDPSGNLWWIATHVEDVSHEEEKRRIAAMADKWD